MLGARLVAALARPPSAWPIDGQLYAQGLLVLALLLLSGMLLYRVLATLTLSYAVDRNGVYIFWLGNRAVVPLQQIESVESGLTLPPSLGAVLRSVGYNHGQVRTREGRVVHRFATVSLRRSLVLHTAAASYALSPQDSDGFVQDLEQRRRLGSIQQLAPGVEQGRLFLYAFWEDRIVRSALLLALVLNLALFGWLMLMYPSLPALVELRANAAGTAAALRPRYQLLVLPLAGSVVGLLNAGLGLTLYGREPAGARLLQIASVVVQSLFVVAALTILR